MAVSFILWYSCLSIYDSAWFTGGTARNVMTVNGAAQRPAGRRKSVRAKSPVPLLPMGAAFIPNLIGIYVCILRFQGEQKNI